MERNSLTFTNDMSRILRGIAIIFMVANHSMPGKVIGFAVPLFSFMVGYGYFFAKDKGLHNSMKRIWHLLSGYWFAIFAICLPIALYASQKPLQIPDIALAMFGMNPCLSCFCWYVYFYIFAMLLMPLLSRIVDKFSWKGTLAVCLAFGGIYWWLNGIDPDDRVWGWNIASRTTRYIPVIVVGYFIAKHNIVALIKLPKVPMVPLLSLGLMVAIYFLRGLPYAMIFDSLWAPSFAFCCSAFFTYGFKPLRVVLTEFGMKSMNIWFLHALFFTTATKPFAYPFVSWIHQPLLFALTILLLSYLLAVVTDSLFAGFKYLLSKTTRLLPRQLSFPLR